MTEQNESLLTQKEIDMVDKKGVVEGDIVPYLQAQLAKVQKPRPELREKIEEILLSKELLEIGRKAIEDALIDWRDDRLSEFTRGNGLVIREKDGNDSSIIRFGPETALKIGIKAMLKHTKLLALYPDIDEVRTRIAELENSREADLILAKNEGIKEVVEWLLEGDDMPLADEYKYPPRTVAQVKAQLREWGL